MRYFGSTTKSHITDAIAQIDSNCGWPDGQTQTWDTPRSVKRRNDDADIWICEKCSGSHGFTAEEMLSGVSGLDEYDRADVVLEPN